MSAELPRILILGPNYSGKTTFFRNFVNKRSIRTILYPGTNINIHTGLVKINKKKYEVIDSPGIHNLIPTSESEIIVLRLILEYRPEKIILVINEKEVEQDLLIMLQLAELGIPFIINFYRRNDFSPPLQNLDFNRLRNLFNAHIVHTTPLLKKGVMSTKKALANITKPRWIRKYSRQIESTINVIEDILREKIGIKMAASHKFISILIILKCQPAQDWLRKILSEKDWQNVLTLLKNNYAYKYAYLIANNWKTLTKSLENEVLIKEPVQRSKIIPVLNKYSLSFFWDIFLIVIVLLLWFFFIFTIGNKFLVNILYTQLFGRYLEPFFSSIFYFAFGDSFLYKLFMGPFGIFSIGITYAFAIILPTIFVFFLYLSTLDEIGYLSRISISLNKLFKFLGLNGYSFPTAMLGNSCKVLSVTKSKVLETSKEKVLILVILLLAIPCISQLGIISNLLAIIPSNFTLIYISIMSIQLIIASKIMNKLVPGKESSFIVKITPLRIPKVSAIFYKSFLYLKWYIKEIVPLLLISTFILFCLEQIGIIALLNNIIRPVITKSLDLPPQFANAAIYGLFRKDFGAVYLYDLANNGMLNSIQVLVSLIYISTSIPCLSFVLAIYKEQGSRYSLKVFLISILYAFCLAFIINKFLRI